MGKVISLKLTRQEERIVKRLNQEGITNSELLRSALWDYFKPSGESLNKADYLDEATSAKDDEDKQFFYDSLYRLNNEVNFLREENKKVKEELSGEISLLKDQISDESYVFYSKEEHFDPREKYAFDIRKNIDKLLHNRQ